MSFDISSKGSGSAIKSATFDKACVRNRDGSDPKLKILTCEYIAASCDFCSESRFQKISATFRRLFRLPSEQVLSGAASPKSPSPEIAFFDSLTVRPHQAIPDIVIISINLNNPAQMGALGTTPRRLPANHYRLELIINMVKGTLGPCFQLLSSFLRGLTWRHPPE